MQTEIKTLIHLSGTTFQIEDNFKRLYDSKFIDPAKLGLVTIFYNTSFNDIEVGPVKLFFTDGTAIYLNLTAGYGGTGPHTTCDILSKFDIPEFNSDDILKDQDIVNIRYNLTGTEFVFSDGTIA